MTFYQVVNEIRKINEGKFLYLNPNFCSVKDRCVLFCDISKLKDLPNGFFVANSKLVDRSVNPNIEYEIRPLEYLKNIESNSEYRVYPRFDSDFKISDSIKNIIEEIKRLNLEVVDGIVKEIKILYDEEKNTFVCNRELKTLKLPDGFYKLGDSLFKNDNNQYGFAYCNPLNVTNYSSYIYPDFSIQQKFDNLRDLANSIQLLNPNCKIWYYEDDEGHKSIHSTIKLKDLVMPGNYYISDTYGEIRYIDDSCKDIFIGLGYNINNKEYDEEQFMGKRIATDVNIFGQINRAKKHIVYELDANGNFIYENGKRKTRYGTLQESIDSLKSARATLIAKKEIATEESKEKSEIIAEAFFKGRRLAEANNNMEYERIVNDLNTKIQTLPIGNKNRINYEIELSEFNKGYNFDETKKTIERRKKHIIVKKEATGINQEIILVGATIMYGAGTVLYRQENPAALFEYVETETFKKGKKECKPGFIARGCKKLLEKVKLYASNIENYDFMNDEEVDINAYARRSFNA